MTLDDVYGEFSRRLSIHGKVVIAGGAVRDILMSQEPKDWDVFVLMDRKVYASVDDAKIPIHASISDLLESDTGDDDYPASKWDCTWKGLPVQVIVSEHQTMEELIASFDWNVCLFGFDGTKYHRGMDVENIKEGSVLVLTNVKWPFNTLRRGFRFSERYGMRLQRQDIIRLCGAVIGESLQGQITTENPDVVDIIQ